MTPREAIEAANKIKLPDDFRWYLSRNGDERWIINLIDHHTNKAACGSIEETPRGFEEVLKSMCIAMLDIRVSKAVELAKAMGHDLQYHGMIYNPATMSHG